TRFPTGENEGPGLPELRKPVQDAHPGPPGRSEEILRTSPGRRGPSPKILRIPVQPDERRIQILILQTDSGGANKRRDAEDAEFRREGIETLRSSAFSASLRLSVCSVHWC